MHYGASWQPCGAVGLGLSQVLSRARSLMQGGLVVARGVAWALLGRGTAALRRPGGHPVGIPQRPMNSRVEGKQKPRSGPAEVQQRSSRGRAAVQPKSRRSPAGVRGPFSKGSVEAQGGPRSSRREAPPEERSDYAEVTSVSPWPRRARLRVASGRRGYSAGHVRGDSRGRDGQRIISE